MPQAAFDPENKATSIYSYPGVKLTKGAIARLAVLDIYPTYEYVHTIRQPQIVGGVAQMETAKRRDGSEYQRLALDFVSRPRCLGDPTVIAKKGTDSDACPACKAAVLTQDVSPPVRRFAAHVFSYGIVGNGNFAVAEPFRGDLLLWQFTDEKFNELTDLVNAWKASNPNLTIGDIDLLIGPCTNEGFQKWDMKPFPGSEWKATPERQQFVAATYQASKCENVSDVIARQLGAETLGEMVEAVLAKFQLARGGTPGGYAGPAPTAVPPMDAESLANILGGAAAPPMVPQPAAAVAPMPPVAPAVAPPLAPAATLPAGLPEAPTAPQEAPPAALAALLGQPAAAPTPPVAQTVPPTPPAPVPTPTPTPPPAPAPVPQPAPTAEAPTLEQLMAQLASP